MNNFNCHICNNEELLRVINRKIGGQVAECVKCGHLSLWPQPDNKEVLDQYTESAYVVNRGVGKALFDNRTIKLMKKLDSRKNLSVLDVGCGTGEFLYECMRNNHQVTGIEVTKNIVDHLVSEGMDVHFKSLSDFSEINKQYDWVACLDVIEHMKEPLESIKNLADLVKPQGLLVIETPNGDSIALHGESSYGLHGDKEHLHYFRVEQLIRLFEARGLKLVHKKFYPANAGCGRVKRFNKKTTSFEASQPDDTNVYRKLSKPRGIRFLIDKAPPLLRGLLRSEITVNRPISQIRLCIGLVLVEP